MLTAHIIRCLRRIAGAHHEVLPHRLELDGNVVWCRDEPQAELIRRLYEAWTRESERSSSVSGNAQDE